MPILFISVLSCVDADEPSPLRVVYFDNDAPYSWRDRDVEMRGVFVDVLDAIIRDGMGQPVGHFGLPWARAQQYVRIGEFDAMIAPVTEARREYADISRQPVVNSRMALFTRASHPKLSELRKTRVLADVGSFRFVTQLGDGWAQENLRGMEVLYASNLDSVLRVLSLGRADLFVKASLVTHWNLKRLGLSDVVTEVDDVTVETTPYHPMVSKKSTHKILPGFDRQMQAFVQSRAMDRLLDKYKK